MMMRVRQLLRRFTLALSGCVVVALQAGCQTELLAPPDGTPERQGRIAETGQSILAINRSDQLLQISVEDVANDDCPVVFVINGGTVIGVETSGGEAKEGTISDLEIGAEVWVWAADPVQLSCPGLGTAAWVLVKES